MVKRLDVNEPLKVEYCIPLWLRDQQIEASTRRVHGRIEAGEKRADRIAIVCYGPSLNDTWEEIKSFDYVMSCSGSHRFLVERGIVPTYHVEVDPRAHKVALIGPPQKETQYLIASTCHAAVFDHLEGHDVKLWHVFDSQEDAVRTLPHGEWALTGGCSVGLRTMTVARFLGFTEQHIFGMDGCEGATGKHAAEHPSQPKGHSIVEYGGVEYRTTPSMLEVAKGTWHELNQMPDVNATFYGEGLVQAMARDYVRKPVGAKYQPTIGVNKPELISATYRELNAELHRTSVAYGVGGEKHAATVLRLADSIQSKNILDYGCGKGRLARALPYQIAEYDPAIPGKGESPKPADLVVSTDVLEHVEPERILYVLDDLRRVTRRIGYLVIHTGPSSKVLSDGRNAHVLQRDRAWWERMLSKFFHVAKVWQVGPLLYVLVAPKGKAKPKAALIHRGTRDGVAVNTPPQVTE